MNRRILAASASVLLALPGCLASTYFTGLPAGGEKHEMGIDYFLFGLVGAKDLDLAQVCPNGVAEWKDYATASDVALTFIACGGLIYSPRTIEVQCAGPTPGSASVFYLVPDPSQHRTHVVRASASGAGGGAGS